VLGNVWKPALRLLPLVEAGESRHLLVEGLPRVQSSLDEAADQVTEGDFVRATSGNPGWSTVCK
jgi:hypothetical protein